jgi:hypothetical protein
MNAAAVISRSDLDVLLGVRDRRRANKIIRKARLKAVGRSGRGSERFFSLSGPAIKNLPEGARDALYKRFCRTADATLATKAEANVESLAVEAKSDDLDGVPPKLAERTDARAEILVSRRSFEGDNAGFVALYNEG